MVKCKKCGQEFIPEKQLAHIKNKLGMDTLEPLCGKCKKAAAAEKLKDIYKDVPKNKPPTK